MLSQRRVLFSDDADRSATAVRSASMVGELVEVEGLSARVLVPVPNRDNDDDMRTNMEVIVRRLAWCILVRHPGTGVHVGDADPVDVSRSPGKALLEPV